MLLSLAAAAAAEAPVTADGAGARGDAEPGASKKNCRRQWEQQQRGLTFKDQQSPKAVVFADQADHSASKGLRHEERCGGTSPSSDHPWPCWVLRHRSIPSSS